MKKNILLLFALFISVSMFAQGDSLSISETTFNESASLMDNPTDLVGHGTVTNNSNTTKVFTWERLSVDIPEPWTTAVCDKNNCYLPTVDTQNFGLEAGEEGTMDVHVYPTGSPSTMTGATAGVGTIVVRIFETDNPENEEVGTYIFTVTDGTSSVEYIKKNDIRLYPNPVKNGFQLTENDIVDRVEITNIIGQNIKGFQVLNGQVYDISTLRNGFYLVQLKDKKGKTIKTTKIYKN